MNQHAIFLPMGALVLLTFLVLILIPIRRIAAGRRGQIKTDDFKYGESATVPGHVSIPNRNYMNLLELPMLFYVVCLMFHSLGLVDEIALVLAWLYVALRVLHSAIHLSHNNVIHRLFAFTASNVVLGVMWTWFFVRAWPALV
jgi:hypothetical protein